MYSDKAILQMLKTKSPKEVQKIVHCSYDRIYRLIGKDKAKEKAIEKISNKYSLDQLQIIANGASKTLTREDVRVDFSGKYFQFGVISDTHLGSAYTNPDKILAAFRVFDDWSCEGRKLQFVLHCGDVTEGWKTSRTGSILEQSHLGYGPQKKHAIDIFSQCRLPIYAVSGNHDLWFSQQINANIVDDLAEMLPNFHCIGQDEGEIYISGIKIVLSHGNDGSSYATSYRVQKKIESYSGGDKPQILFMGHAHKHLYMFERNVHAFQAGCLQDQSAWMKSKRLSASVGFWIVEVKHNNEEVVSIRPEFFPFYR